MMRSTQLIKSIQQRCTRGILYMALGVAISLGAPSLAAEVKPTSVEVVGQSGSATVLAPDAPPAPTSPAPDDRSLDSDSSSNDSSSYESMYQDRPAQREVDELARAIPELMAEIKREMHQEQTDYSFLIPILAVLLIFGGPIVLVIVLAVLRYRTRARRERNHNENIARLLEAGRDVPLELLLGADAPVQKVQNNLRKGIENVCVGTALLIFLSLMVGVDIGAVGLIVIAYGVSQLAVWKLIDSKVTSTESTDTAKRD